MSKPLTLEEKIGNRFNELLLRHLEAMFVITEAEEKLSDERAESYRKQYEEYKDDQRRKYGIEQGNFVSCRDPFIPHL